MNDEFVVYVSHPRIYMMIHSTSCGYYVHSDQKVPKNGKWSDKFKTLKDTKTLPKKNKDEKFIKFYSHQIISVIHEILGTKLNEVPTIKFNQLYKQTRTQKRNKR